jgi:hypothetical protein
MISISSVLRAVIYQHETAIPPPRNRAILPMYVLMIHEMIVNPFSCADGRTPGMWVSLLALVYRKPVVLIVFRWVGGKKKHNVLEPKRNMDQSIGYVNNT